MAAVEQSLLLWVAAQTATSDLDSLINIGKDMLTAIVVVAFAVEVE